MQNSGHRRTHSAGSHSRFRIFECRSRGPFPFPPLLVLDKRRDSNRNCGEAILSMDRKYIFFLMENFVCSGAGCLKHHIRDLKQELPHPNIFTCGEATQVNG